MTVQIETIFLDMDGVLSNFMHALCKLYNANHAVLIENWNQGQYDVHPNLMNVLRAHQVEPAHVMYDRIRKQGSDFWMDMHQYEHARWFVKKLLVICKEHRIDLRILTSPGTFPHAATAKLLWLEKFSRGLGTNLADNAFIGCEKKYLAGPGRVLIDDTAKHVSNFCGIDGCHGILFPQIWNSGWVNSMPCAEGEPCPTYEEKLEAGANGVLGTLGTLVEQHWQPAPNPA